MHLFFLFLIPASLSEVDIYCCECEDNEYCLAYEYALSIAKIPTSARISKSLTPIRYSNPRLTFDAEGRVLLASSALANYYPYRPGEKFQLPEQTWFTVYPDLRDSCKFYSRFEDKALRMKQELGLPPVDKITGVVEVFVSLSDIFRPCADPEISDMECQVSIPILNDNSTDPQVPWYCPSDGEEIEQVGGTWARVANSHFLWMCENWKEFYLNEEIYENYPWTGLGYTYDWGSEDGMGLSEFVVPAGTNVVFHKKMSVEEYCLL